MDLLAYGGNEFAERQRFGEWPSEVAGVFRDLYGLSFELLTFGVARRNGRCYIVVRQRQNVQNRGGYPYTLLLDPGRDMLQSLGWNPGWLLYKLFETDKCPGRVLLETPEKIGRTALGELLLSVAPPEEAALASADDIVPGLLVAGLGRPHAMAVPANSFYGERPTMMRLAQALDRLPVCFRSSVTWLVGGGAANGEVLGSSIVFDTLAEGEFNIADLGEAGGYWPAWQLLANDSRFTNDIAAYNARPAWEWEEPVCDVLKTAVRISRCVERGLNDDDYSWLRTQPETAPFAASMRGLAMEAILDAGEDCTEIETEYLLDRALNHREKLANAVICRLEPITVEREFRHRGLELWRPPDTLPFPKAWLATPLGVALHDASVSTVPALLTEIMRWAGLDGQAFHELTKIAAERLADFDGPLAAFDTVLNGNDRYPELTEARQRNAESRLASTKHQDWMREYIAYADDPGGARLANGSVPGTVVDSICDALKEKTRGWEHWVAALPTSLLRMKISVVDKHELATLSGVTEWQPFLALSRLYEGDELKTLPEIDTGERLFLIHEFGELLARSARVDKAPRLKEILHLLGGGLPSELRDRVLRLEVRDCLCLSFASYVAGLKQLDSKRGGIEAARAATEKEKVAKRESKAAKEPPEDVRIQLAEVLFGSAVNTSQAQVEPTPSEPAAPELTAATPSIEPDIFRFLDSFRSPRKKPKPEPAKPEPRSVNVDPAEEEKHYQQLRNLLKTWTDYPKFRQMLNATVRARINDERNVFGRRVFRLLAEPRNASLLLGALDEDLQNAAMRAADESDPVEFVNWATEIVGQWIDDRQRSRTPPVPEVLPCFVALLRYLHISAKERGPAGSGVVKNLRLSPDDLLKNQQYLEQGPEARKREGE